MYLNNSQKVLNAKQGGLGLPVALFIIVIMSLIAIAVNQLGASSSQSYSQNVLSTRAFYAAESGAQLRAENTLTPTACACSGGADVTYNFTVTGLNQCSAVTNCTSFSANGNTYCTIVSIGRCNNAVAERTVEVRLK
jgi:MSHA biogenesis protein MshP